MKAPFGQHEFTTSTDCSTSTGSTTSRPGGSEGDPRQRLGQGRRPGCRASTATRSATTTNTRTATSSSTPRATTTGLSDREGPTSSPSSDRPRPASRTWPSPSPSASTARSSTPTRCSSTAAWTSAPRSCRRPSAAGSSHHQLDVLDVREEASVAAYQRHSRADIAAIHGTWTGRVLVGGSGLYLRAALDRLEIPPTDPAVRARLEAELAEHGLEPLRDRLHDVDPVAADAIEANNGRRIVRALEVVELTGRPFSATMPTREHRLPTVLLGLGADRPVLDERIDRRVRRMWRRAWSTR